MLKCSNVSEALSPCSSRDRTPRLGVNHLGALIFDGYFYFVKKKGDLDEQ